MPALTIGLDIAKNVFQIHGVDRHGKVAIQRKLPRSDVLKFFAKLKHSLVGIEACHGSQFWAWKLTVLGHTVRLLPTQYVKPFLVGGKNDANDAAAICAAVTRPNIHFVAIKSAEQLALQSLHRMRQRLILERTAKSNQIRSMFAEEGVIFPIGLSQMRKGIVELVNNANSGITLLLRRLGSMYLEQLETLQQWLDELTGEISKIFKNNEAFQRLATVPGIGPVIATALVSSVAILHSSKAVDSSQRGSG
jgi:transposase